ncbi:hypothetical protein ACHAPT_001108 [Fusarium lateritium]
MDPKIPLEVLSSGITGALAETASLREKCQSQQLEIKSLRAHKRESDKEMEFLIYARNLYDGKMTEKDDEIRRLDGLVCVWTEKCRVLDEKLVAAKQDIEALKAKQESSQEQIKNLEQETLDYRQQIKKLLHVLRNKTRTARVASIAIKATYKLLISLKEQGTMQRLYELSEKAVKPRWVEQEVDALLKEMGIKLLADDTKDSNTTNDSLRTPALSPNEVTTDDGERASFKRKRGE